VIVAGFGYRAAAQVASLRAALALAGTDRPTIDALAAPHDKLPVLLALADALGLPVIAVAPDALRVASTHTRSPASLAARGVGSVADVAALAAAGEGSRLLSPRHVSPDRKATCAIAEGHRQ